MPDTIRILLVEDNPGDARLVSESIRELGVDACRLTNVASLEEARRAVSQHRYDVILLDLSLPDAFGLDTVTRVHQFASTIPIVVMTGTNDERLAIEAVKAGVQDYLVKGEVDPKALFRAVRHSRERKRAQEALARQACEARLLHQTAAIAAGIDPFRQMIQRVVNVVCAALDWPVGRVFLPRGDESDDTAASSIWHYSEVIVAKARERFQDDDHPDALRLAHRIQASGQSESLVESAATQRPDSAMSIAGMRAACGFPVNVGDEIVAVLEFFSPHAIVPDDSLLAVASNVCTQLGRIFERHRSDSALRKAHDELEQRVEDRTAQLQQEIAERLRVESDLKEAKEAAESASRAKGEFLATMSHELRTPLNGVIGSIDLLLRTELNERQRHFAALAKSSGEILLNVINDVLDFSKIEAGRLELEHVDFDLRTVVDEVVSAQALRAEGKGVELICGIHPEARTLLRGDPVRLGQIVMNLVGNAVKFTDKGQVLVRVVPEANTGTHGRLRVEVRDTGIGISSDCRDRLFSAFSQADSSTTRRFGGSGLGLAITKRLVEAMGGEIGVTSDPGRGSTFWFTLRLERQSAEARDASPPPEIQGTRTLLVDDNETNREILTEQLASAGIHNDAMARGGEALAAMRTEARDGRPYELVILDMKMPEMSGDEVAQRVRRDPLLKDARLILLTSIDRACDAQDLRSAGFDGWLSKPVRRDQLIGVIQRTLTGGRPSGVASECASAPRAPTPRRNRSDRILLAEDNEIGREVAVAILHEAGFDCDSATNGQEAVDAVGSGRYSLVLMDCQMPVMDGFAAARAIRNMERSRNGIDARPIPIIALTANVLKGDRERCLDAGMNDYVTKPLDSRRLLETIEKHLSLSTPQPPNCDDGSTPSGIQQGRSDASPDAAAIIRALVEKWNGDTAMVDRIVQSFTRQIREALTEIESSLGEGNATAAGRAAHRLKGAAGEIGDESLWSRLGHIEEVAKIGDLAAAQNTIEALRRDAERWLSSATATAR